MLGVHETDLWPQLRPNRTRPDEVLAIYPHRDTVPREVWLSVFGSARQEIGMLEDASVSVAADQPIAAVLAERAAFGVNVRICLYNTSAPTVALGVARPQDAGASVGSLREALSIYAPLREKGDVEIRLHQGAAYSSIYCVDDQVLVSQHAYGIPIQSAPILKMRRTEGGDMVVAYVDAFKLAWAAGRRW